MPDKSVREMGAFSRRHHSLGGKLFRMIIALSLVICLAAVTFSFVLYSNAVRNEYKAVSFNIAETASIMVNIKDVLGYADKTIKAYEAAPNDLIEDQFDEDYARLFRKVQDKGFEKIQNELDVICKDNEAKSIYFAALDGENQRLVYLIDSDKTETFCPPGRYEELDEKEFNNYEGHIRPGTMEKSLGNNNAYPAAITDTEEFGYLCTACKIVGSYKDYDIGLFVDKDMNHVVGMSKRFLIRLVVILAAIVLILGIIFSLRMRKKIAEPIGKISDAAENYAKDRKHGIRESHFEKIDIRTGDEIEDLSLVMKDMEREIAGYEEEIGRTTAEKERIATELNLGRNIQASMLPNFFPPFPDRSEFDIYALMEPAKEVGGDFYDFFFIDEDHLALVMADVSGKGVPAALFMMASKILLGDFCMTGNSSPAQILEKVNERMVQKENVDMFVTVWLGILEVSTGKIVAANAGHEYPAIRRAGGTYEIYKDKHGFVLGGMEDMEYTDYELKLEEGDSIFVYTDGVSEATNEKKELFGTERMIQALNRKPDTSAEKTLRNMQLEIMKFTGSEEQFDDITMMCLKYKGNQSEDGEKAMNDSDTLSAKKTGDTKAAAGAFGDEYVFETDAKVDNLHEALAFIDSNLEEAECPPKILAQIDVAVEEIFVNISSYAYGDETGRITLKVKAGGDPRAAVITIIDSGIPYDPLAKEDPDVTLSAEERQIGGLGIFMTKQFMDELEYEYKDGHNMLTLKKYM